MKKLFSLLFFSLLIGSAFAQVDTLSPEKKVQYRIQQLQGQRINALPDFAITNALKSLAEFSAGKTSNLTIKELRAGKADTSQIVQILDTDKSGLFKYIKTDVSSQDDSTFVLVSGNRRYIREIDAFYNTKWLNTNNLERQFFKMIDRIGSSPQTVILNKTIPITSNRTIPKNVKINFQSGAVFDIQTGFTLTILSPIQEADFQLFGGEGNVIVTDVPEVKMAWYGLNSGLSGSNDIQVSRALFTAARNGNKKIVFPHGEFRFSKTIQCREEHGGLIVEGAGMSHRTAGDAYKGTALYFANNTNENVFWQLSEPDTLPEGANMYNGVQGFTFRNMYMYAGGGTPTDIASWPAQKYRAGKIGIYDNRGGNIRLENVGLSYWDTAIKLINSDFSSSQNVRLYYNNLGIYIGPRSDQNTHIDSDLTFCNTGIEVSGVRGLTLMRPNFVFCGTETAGMLKINVGDNNNSVYGVTIVEPWFEQNVTSLNNRGVTHDFYACLEVGTKNNQYGGTVSALIIIGSTGTHSYLSTTGGNILHYIVCENLTQASIVQPYSNGYKTTGIRMNGAYSPNIRTEGYLFATSKEAGNNGIVVNYRNDNGFSLSSNKHRFRNISAVASTVPWATLDGRHGTIFESGTADTGIWLANDISATIYAGKPSDSNTAGLGKYLRWYHAEPAGSLENYAVLNIGPTRYLFKNNTIKRLTGTNTENDIFQPITTILPAVTNSITISSSSSYIVLDNISVASNRIVTLPDVSSNAGKTIILNIKNTTAYSWLLAAGSNVLDFQGSTVTRFKNQSVYTIISDGSNWIVQSENSIGSVVNKTFTASGNGTTTVSIPHGLPYTPVAPLVQAGNAASVGVSFVTADAANIVVNFSAPTTTGTDNLSFNVSYSIN